MKIELYTRVSCGYCDQVKKLLKDKGLPYKEFIIEQNITREQVLEKFPTAKTLPVVVVDDEWIGGRDELFRLIYDRGA